MAAVFFSVVSRGAEFADVTFEEFRDARLMKGSQECSATEGNHVMTSAELPKTVRAPIGIVLMIFPCIQ